MPLGVEASDLKISNEQAESSLRYLRETPPPGQPLRPVAQPVPEEVMAVLEHFSDNDEIRDALVAEVTRELEASSYEVPTDWVAEKMVGRLVSDRLR